MFPNGLPVHDTIARIISALDPAEFQQCFIHWAQSVNERTGSELIAIDGKTLRGSYNREDRRSAIHMVSAFAVDNKVVMGQLKTEEKSNEITAIPALLSLLDINGCLVSIDAMGCQTKIADSIISQGGDYLLAVKDNQALLHQAVQRELRPVHSAGSHPENVIIEQGHGRTEAREYHVLPADTLREEFPEWTGMKTLGVAIGYRHDKSGKSSLAYRYYISSAELDTAQFAAAVRGHWGIENSLHWVLDVAMKEDACPIYRENAAEILAGFRHIGLNMLRSETSRKASIRRKQKMASMNSAYLEQVIIAGMASLGKK
ncbi:putative transposase YbfD/YdcC [Oceanisphaera litoralis]|nr:putative transposase YbfD/YdcC [Oceanisphaera litoralis]